MLIFFVGEVFLLYFWDGLHLQTLIFFLAITLIWEMLNISTANDSTFTVIGTHETVISLYSNTTMMNYYLYGFILLVISTCYQDRTTPNASKGTLALEMLISILGYI